jgi:hypothetical protein
LYFAGRKKPKEKAGGKIKKGHFFSLSLCFPRRRVDLSAQESLQFIDIKLPRGQKTMADNAKSIKKWGKDEDAKLASLFRKGLTHGGVSSKDLTADTIKAINNKYFKERDPKNFSPLFRAKAQAWNIDQSLTGARSKFAHVLSCHMSHNY